MLNRAVKPLVVSLESVKRDPALLPTARGARKIVVTSIFSGKEKSYNDPQWEGLAVESPVMLMEDTEYAVFTQTTVQDRHFHKNGTEFYTVLEGTMQIEVEGELFMLTTGDTIVIPRGVIHEVLRDSSFMASVITVHCGGVTDKYIVEKTNTK